METHKPNGDLTAYGLACGYVQRHGEITLTKDGVYHVRDGFGYWESFDKLTDARQDYARIVKLWNKAVAMVNTQDTADGLRGVN